MNFASIAHVLGKLLIVTGCSMVLPLACSIYYGENDLFSLFISGIITLLLGWPLWWFFRRHYELNIKDGFFIAVFRMGSDFCGVGTAFHDSRLHPLIYRRFF